MEYFLTIIAKPETAIFTANNLKEHTNLLEKNNIVILAKTILSENEAIDYHLKGDEKNIKKLTQQFFLDKPVDIFVQKTANRKKKLLISDMDATLIKNECIDEIANMIGKGDEVAEITRAAMNGQTLFEGSLLNRVNLLKGTKKETLQEIFDNVITFNKGAKTLAATMRKNKAIMIIVSGGFSFFAKRVKKELGFHYSYSNKLEVRKGLLTGRLIAPIFDGKDKLEIMKGFMESHFIKEDEILAIGDGANDLPMLTNTYLGVAYKAKEVVNKELNFKLAFNDLDALLFIQGYHRKEFINKE